MIDIIKFKQILLKNFDSSKISFDEFKPDLQYAEIDCLKDKNYRLIIELTKESVKFSTISARPQLDFSLYDYSLKSINEAEELIEAIKISGELPLKS